MINGAHVVIYSKNSEADRAFFPRCLQISVGRCRPRLVDFRSASGGGRVPRLREQRPARALLHVRRHRRHGQRSQGEKCEGRRSEKGAVGKSGQLDASGRWHGGYLRAQTCEPAAESGLKLSLKTITAAPVRIEAARIQPCDPRPA